MAPDHDPHAASAQFSTICITVVTAHRPQEAGCHRHNAKLPFFGTTPFVSPVDASSVIMRVSLLDLDRDEQSMDHAPRVHFCAQQKQLWCEAQQK
jgi:hypothetical protein